MDQKGTQIKKMPLKKKFLKLQTKAFKNTMPVSCKFSPCHNQYRTVATIQFLEASPDSFVSFLQIQKCLQSEGQRTTP